MKTTANKSVAVSPSIAAQIEAAVAAALSARGSRKSAPAVETISEKVFRITGLQKSSFRGRVAAYMLEKGPGVYTAVEIHENVPGIDYANISASFKHIAYVLERNPCGFSVGFAGRNEKAEARLYSDEPKPVKARSAKPKAPVAHSDDVPAGE